jgi:DNA-binding response OmpR family regulator
MDAPPLELRSHSHASREGEQCGPAISAGPIHLDLATYVGSMDGSYLALTKAEFDLLAYLIRHQDRVLPPQEIAREVFGTRASTAVQLIRVHVCHIRQALGQHAVMLSTVRGRGYRIIAR